MEILQSYLMQRYKTILMFLIIYTILLIITPVIKSDCIIQMFKTKNWYCCLYQSIILPLIFILVLIVQFGTFIRKTINKQLQKIQIKYIYLIILLATAVYLIGYKQIQGYKYYYQSHKHKMNQLYQQFFDGNEKWQGYNSYKKMLIKITRQNSIVNSVLDEGSKIRFKELEKIYKYTNIQYKNILNTNIQSPYSDGLVEVYEIINDTFQESFNYTLHDQINLQITNLLQKINQLNSQISKQNIIKFAKKLRSDQSQINGWLANYKLYIAVGEAIYCDGLIYLYLLILINYILFVLMFKNTYFKILKNKIWHHLILIGFVCGGLMLLSLITISYAGLGQIFAYQREKSFSIKKLGLLKSFYVDRQNINCIQQNSSSHNQQQFNNLKKLIEQLAILKSEKIKLYQYKHSVQNVKNFENISINTKRFNLKYIVQSINLDLQSQPIFQNCRHIKLQFLKNQCKSESQCYTFQNHQSLPESCKITPLIFSTMKSFSIQITLLEQNLNKIENILDEISQKTEDLEKYMKKSNFSCKIWKQFYDRLLEFQSDILSTFSFFVRWIVIINIILIVILNKTQKNQDYLPVSSI